MSALDQVLGRAVEGVVGGAILNLVQEARAELLELREREETLQLQLAGCGVVAMANTRRSAEEVRNGIAEKYKCASLSDVCRAVDREIDLRERVAKLESAIAKAGEMADAAELVILGATPQFACLGTSIGSFRAALDAAK